MVVVVVVSCFVGVVVVTGVIGHLGTFRVASDALAATAVVDFVFVVVVVVVVVVVCEVVVVVVVVVLVASVV